MPETRNTILTALLGPMEEQLRRKGSQKGSVRVRGGNWHITYYEWVSDQTTGDVDYRQVSRKVGPARGPERITKRQAEDSGYEKFVLPANGPAHCPQGLATVQQFVDIRFRPDHIDQLKKSGRVFYEAMLKKQVLPTIGGIRLADVTPQIVQSLISSKRAAGLSSQTLKHIRNVVSAIFRHAKALKMWKGDLPTEGTKLPQVVHAKRNALTRVQLQLLAEAVQPTYAPLVVFLGHTGLRIGEACGLRWSNVNVTDEWKIVGDDAIPPNSILVGEGENWVLGERTTLKTRSSYRKVPLTANTWVALMTVRESSKFTGEDQPVFAARNGKPIDGHNVAARFLKPAGLAIGCPWVSWHALRHTAASISDTVLTPAQKQSIMGHASHGMSLRYTHVQIEETRVQLEKAEERRIN